MKKKKQTTLPPLYGLLFMISSKIFFNVPSHRHSGGVYLGLSYTSCGELAGTRNELVH